MNKYLVHFDALQSRAYGVWWIEEGKVRSLYTDPEGGMAARGGLMVLNKSNSNVSWEDWFDQNKGICSTCGVKMRPHQKGVRGCNMHWVTVGAQRSGAGACSVSGQAKNGEPR